MSAPPPPPDQTADSAADSAADGAAHSAADDATTAAARRVDPWGQPPAPWGQPADAPSVVAPAAPVVQQDPAAAARWEAQQAELRAWMDAQLERERAEVQAREAALALKPRRVRKGTGTTVVLSIRLDIDEMRSLEGRAALLDMKPTVLARNLIRTGLRQRGDAGLITAVEQLTALVDEIRGLVG